MSRTILFQAPDISQYQGNVNIKAMRDAGYPAVILRAGWGQNNRDPRYAYNAEACRNLGVMTAIYWFSYALTDDAVRREAEYAIKAAEEYFPKTPIAFDLEYDSRRYAAKNGINMDRAMITRHAIIFLQAVAKAGHKPILYTNRDYLRNFFDLAQIQAAVPDLTVWFAYYSNSEPAELEKSAIWQYTSKGSVPGISGNVDLNKVFCNIFVNQTVAAEQPTVNQPCNLYVQAFQRAANIDGYRDQAGAKLSEDGVDGPKTQYVRKQITLRAKLGFLKIERSTGEVVKWLQGRLNECMEADLTITGEYDAETVKAVKHFQKTYNLAVDGVAGYNTLQMLFYN